MYAQRFADGPRFRPASLAAALAINGGVIAALLFAGPELARIVTDRPLIVTPIPLETPTPPEPALKAKATRPNPQPRDHIVATKSLVDEGQLEQVQVDDQPGDGPIQTVQPGDGDGGVVIPPPVFVTATIDPLFARDFQPPYPDVQRDLGNEGVVQLRLLIGVDGRVKRVERLSGSDAFYRAASTQALAHWRFRPATRGGIPEESWRTMSVRFQLNG